MSQLVKRMQSRAPVVHITNAHIQALEDAVRREGLDELHTKEGIAEVKHYYAPGVYCREITMLKDHLYIGKIHKTEHINIISKGKAIVVTEDDQRMEIEAPYTFVSKAGCKKALYILEDMVWTTVHVTEETDLDKLETQLIAPTWADYQLECEEKARLEELPK